MFRVFHVLEQAVLCLCWDIEFPLNLILVELVCIARVSVDLLKLIEGYKPHALLISCNQGTNKVLRAFNKLLR